MLARQPVALAVMLLFCSVLGSASGERIVLQERITSSAIATPTTVSTATSPGGTNFQAISPGRSIAVSRTPAPVVNASAPAPAAPQAASRAETTPAAETETAPVATPAATPAATQTSAAAATPTAAAVATTIQTPAATPTEIPAAGRASATASAGGGAPSAATAGVSTVEWEYGVCPLVIKDGDFVGNDVANAKEADVATCCAECLKSVRAWVAANPTEGSMPTAKDSICLAWTFTADKICYLKNSEPRFSRLSLIIVRNGIQKGNTLTYANVTGSYTGYFAGNLTSMQASYDQFVRQYLIPIHVGAAAAASSSAAPGQSVTVRSSCDAPHCQKIVAQVNTTATAAATASTG